MEFRPMTVTSRPGMTQEEALLSLQSDTNFKPGTRIASIRRRGDSWIAHLLEPKVADFPPVDDEGEKPEPKEPKEDKEDAELEAVLDSDDDKPKEDGPSKSDKPHGESEKSELAEVLGLLHTLIEGLGIGGGLGGPDGPGGPPGLGGDVMPPPPPHPPKPPMGGPQGGPPGAGGPPGLGPDGARHIVHERAIKPGEAPPGTTPIGSPAFSSVHQATSVAVAPGGQSASIAPGGAGGGAPTPQGAATCPKCGGPVGADGVCAACAGRTAKVASFTAFSSDSFNSVGEAKASLEASYGHLGYKVKQIRREGSNLYALLSVR